MKAEGSAQALPQQSTASLIHRMYVPQARLRGNVAGFSCGAQLNVHLAPLTWPHGAQVDPQREQHDAHKPRPGLRALRAWGARCKRARFGWRTSGLI